MMEFFLSGMDSMQKNYFLLFWEEYIWKSHRQYRHDLILHPRENLPFRLFLSNLKIFWICFYLKIIEKKGAKIAFLAYTYDNKKQGVNIYSEELVKQDLQYANENALTFVPVDSSTIDESNPHGTVGSTKWEYDTSTSTFTVSGSGSFDYDDDANEYLCEAKNFVVENGVAAIGDNILLNADKLPVGEHFFDFSSDVHGFLRFIREWMWDVSLIILNFLFCK